MTGHDRNSRRTTTLAFVNGEWALSTVTPDGTIYMLVMADPYEDPVTHGHWRIVSDGRVLTFLSGIELLDFTDREAKEHELFDRAEMDAAFNPAVFRDLETRWLALRELTNFTAPVRRRDHGSKESDRARVLNRAGGPTKGPDHDCEVDSAR